MKRRFDSKLRVTPGCWIWTAGFMSNGYGAFAVDGKMRGAHRVSYSLYVGPIEDGLHVLHKCDNKRCVNPDHLFLGTHADNMRDKDAKGRGNHPKGEIHTRAKLTAEDVKRIRADRRPPQIIADEYGVAYTTIRQAKSGQTWNHLSTPNQTKGVLL